MKKFMKYFATGFVTLTILSGCGNATTGQEKEQSLSNEDIIVEDKKSEVVFANYRDVRDLNPHFYAGEMYAQNILYDGLIDMTEDGFEGALAESWEISEDGKTYTFKIREGVKFSDGTDCDADAIKVNFDAIIENKERHVWLTMMTLLQDVKATEDNKIIITLSEPYYPMLTELSMIRPFAIISPNAMIDGGTKNGVEDYIGTGPYKLTEVETDEYAVFEVNEYYWGDKPQIEKITVKVIPDNQTRIMALEKGEIDLIYGKNMLDADSLISHEGNENFEVALSEPTSTRQIVMNTTDEILQDVNVRYAISYATNKEAISKGIFYGIEEVAETLYAKNVPYANIDLEPYTYNKEKADQLLSEAGWTMGSNNILEKDGQALEIGLLYNSDSVTEKTIAEFLQSEYLKIGIKLNIHGEEEQSYRDNMKLGNFDMVFNISWGTPYDPQSSLSAMSGPVYGDYAAQQGLENKEEIDKIISEIMISTEEEQRQELFTYVLTELHESAVYLPLTFESNKALYTSELEGVGFTQSQYEIPFIDMSFKK